MNGHRLTAWLKVITALNMDFIQISAVEVNPAAHLNWNMARVGGEEYQQYVRKEKYNQ